MVYVLEESTQGKLMLDVLIVGAGVSGLCTALLLETHGLNVQVIESRERTGGRLWSPELAGADVDFGASWVWSHERHVLQLLELLNLETFLATPVGVDLLERQGRVIPIQQPTSWSPERQIKGGAQALTHALAERVGQIQLNERATRIESDTEHLCVHTNTSVYHARAVVMALPPALCAQSIVVDDLSEAFVRQLAQTPTWMSQFAKVVAVFKAPFWKQRGLSGRAFSDQGPMGEIHDISGRNNGHGVLFGFAMQSSFSKSQLLEQARQQFERLFGADTSSQLLAMDTHMWWRDEDTVMPSSCATNSAYFGHAFLRQPQCEGRLLFASTETAKEHAGHMDGAVSRAQDVAAYLMARLG